MRPSSLPAMSSPTGPSAAVTVQEFYSAQSTGSSTEERNVRWMSRFTEFMRVAANRSVSGLDRVMDNLGLTQGQQSIHQQNVSMITGRPRDGSMRFSPPEELPAMTARPMPPRTSWTSTSPQQPQPLFSQSQAAQLRQAHRDYPLLYGQASDVGSDHSSRLQAEVQRQMDEYAMKYQEELRSLQGEVQRLRQERQEWKRRTQDQLQADLLEVFANVGKVLMYHRVLQISFQEIQADLKGVFTYAGMVLMYHRVTECSRSASRKFKRTSRESSPTRGWSYRTTECSRSASRKFRRTLRESSPTRGWS